MRSRRINFLGSPWISEFPPVKRSNWRNLVPETSSASARTSKNWRNLLARFWLEIVTRLVAVGIRGSEIDNTRNYDNDFLSIIGGRQFVEYYS